MSLDQMHAHAADRVTDMEIVEPLSARSCRAAIAMSRI
jgi:hypothetical protein